MHMWIPPLTSARVKPSQHHTWLRSCAKSLDIEEGQKILEIGTGSGYHAAIVAQLVGKTGQVYYD